MQLWQYCVY